MVPLPTLHPSRLMCCVQLMALLMTDLPRGAFRHSTSLICPALGGACNQLSGLWEPGLLLWPIQPNRLNKKPRVPYPSVTLLHPDIL